MNREVMFSSRSDNWETPQDLFDKLNEEFHFTLDVAADANNAKCKDYLDKNKNGLNWKWGGVLFYESSLWQRNRQVDKEGIRRKFEWLHGCLSASFEDGYKMVLGLHIRQSGNSVYKRSAEIWRA
jgi:hypothetical protein